MGRTEARLAWLRHKADWGKGRIYFWMVGPTTGCSWAGVP